MPPTTEPLGRDFLDGTFFWILADEKERQALRTYGNPGIGYGRSSSTPPLRARETCGAQASIADPNPLATNGLASPRHRPTGIRLAARCVSTFPLFEARYEETAAYHRELKIKFQFAARCPWLLLDPDPPQPYPPAGAIFRGFWP
jgi:hypothetical protein